MEEQPRQKLCIKLSKLCTIKGIPFYFDRKHSNRISGWDSNIQDYRKRIKLS